MSNYVVMEQSILSKLDSGNKDVGVDPWPEEEASRILVIPWAEGQHNGPKKMMEVDCSSGTS